MLRRAFLLTVCLAAALAVQKVADKDFVTKQKQVYELFWHVDQPTVYHPELYQRARSFNIAENVDKYHDQEAVTEFLKHLNTGTLLPRGQVFSIFYPTMHQEAVLLFRMLHSAKDFETFMDTAVWARFYVNEQMFVYVLSVAVIHRADTRYMQIPPMYEVMPHFFYNEEVMHKAYEVAMGDLGVKKTVGGIDHYFIPANYSGWYLTRHQDPEQKLTYFTEDVGLNSYYFFANHDFPVWMNSSSYHLPQHVRGELYYYGHKQLLARYYLERLANDLGEIDYVNVDKPISKGYYPTMHYPNGLPFPQREQNCEIPLYMHDHVVKLHDLHNRIVTAIDLGKVIDYTGNQIDIYTPEGLNVLGNLIQGNGDTVNTMFYGHFDALCREVLGFGMHTHNKYQVQPSALEIYSTSMRDPIFYSMYKNIITYFLRYKENLPKYNCRDLFFRGVKVESVVVDKLMTYFDQFDSLLSNGVSVKSHQEAQSRLIKARQYRLNHKPFTYYLNVQSEKDTKAVVRVFLGPKYDETGKEIEIEQNYVNFIELDQWMVDLKSGLNKIVRSDHESIYVVPDETPSDVLYKKMVKALEGEEFTYETQVHGFPNRLMLPKGKKEGMQYTLFVIVSPVEEGKLVHIDSPLWGQFVVDQRPMGFPLDRPIGDVSCLNLGNMMFKDVTIYHRQLEELNITV